MPTEFWFLLQLYQPNKSIWTASDFHSLWPGTSPNKKNNGGGNYCCRKLFCGCCQCWIDFLRISFCWYVSVRGCRIGNGVCWRSCLGGQFHRPCSPGNRRPAPMKKAPDFRRFQSLFKTSFRTKSNAASSPSSRRVIRIFSSNSAVAGCSSRRRFLPRRKN